MQLFLHCDSLCSFTCTQRGAVYNCMETSSSGAQLCAHIHKHTHRLLHRYWLYGLWPGLRKEIPANGRAVRLDETRCSLKAPSNKNHSHDIDTNSQNLKLTPPCNAIVLKLQIIQQKTRRIWNLCMLSFVDKVSLKFKGQSNAISNYLPKYFSIKKQASYLP